MARFNHLLEKFIRENLTQAELNEFLVLVKESSNQEALKESLGQILNSDTYMDLSEGMNLDNMFTQVLERAKHTATPVHRVHFLKTAWLRYAAAIIIMLGVGGYLWFNNITKKSNDHPKQANNSSEIVQGSEGKKVVLTLADGSVIILDTVANGTLAQQGNTQVSKLAEGMLVYQPPSEIKGKGTAGNEMMYNTITTPRGGQYQIVLPDGSKVWLNAKSSVRFPTAFSSNERKVEITGEAYFEIAKDKTKPFYVSANGTKVEVLGTSFNINAYSDESTINTTLLEGSIRVFYNNFNTILKPGQQATINEHTTAVNFVNSDQVVAWKNGFFQFRNTSVEAVMRQVARWYDIEVVYESVATEGLNGTIPRSVSASNLFRILELTGKAHFKIEGKKVTVMR